MNISGKDLIDIGYIPGKDFRDYLNDAQSLLDEGKSKDQVLDTMKLRIPAIPDKIKCKTKPSSLEMAIVPETEEERINVTAAIKQMNELLLTPKVLRGAIMPDTCPAGHGTATIPVGGAIEVENAIIPAAHSADICCSMHCSFFLSDENDKSLIDTLQKSTRFGMGGRHPQNQIDHPVIHEAVWQNPYLKGLEDYARKHMADQGDGNHFAYIGSTQVTEEFINWLDTNGYNEYAKGLNNSIGKTVKTLVTHHGSRGLGAQVYKRGMETALKHTKKVADGVPDNATWIDFDSQEGHDYWDALQYTARWTKGNHESIHSLFLNNIKAPSLTSFGNEHNFVWKRGDNFYHGKGATPAWADPEGRPLLGLIPLNMASPVMMVLGKNNDKFLSFAPHGAGRNVSRTALISRFKRADGTIDEELQRQSLIDSTKHIDARWYSGTADISESPLGYKSPDKIKAEINKFDLANVIGEISPHGCIMAGHFPKPWDKKKKK